MENGKIIFVTGGQRSGKSEWAERKALELSKRPVYVATARVWDDEFRARVEAHQRRRGPEWTNFEEPLHPASVPTGDGSVVLLDCVTLWATNVYFELGEDATAALEMMKSEVDALLERCNTYIIVSNEIGLGGVSENAIQRQFTDLQGRINQYIAARAEEAYLMVSGLGLRLK